MQSIGKGPMRGGREAEPKTAASGPEGNLYRAYGEKLGWDGCAYDDCLPACRPSRGHCERLKLFLERGKPQ